MANLEQGVSFRQMNPDEVLAAIRWEHRDWVAHDEADPDAVIDYETTIEQWRDALLIDFESLRALAEVLNDWFGTRFTKAQWRTVLSPRRTKTLRGVCELISTQAVVPAIEPVRVLGRPCLSAGAFVVLRRLIANSGGDAKTVRPSALVDDFIGRSSSWPLELTKLAGDRLPPLKIVRHARYPLYQACVWLLLISCLGIVGGGTLVFRDMDPGGIIPLASAAVFAVTLIVAAVVRRLSPPTIGFANLRTFRDLSHAIIGPEKT